jgi:hypothetical protein
VSTLISSFVFVQVIASNIHGYVESQVVFYLVSGQNINVWLKLTPCFSFQKMNVHIKSRKIWLTRHGESEFNVSNRIGGDSPLTARGKQYAAALGQFIGENHVDGGVEVRCSLSYPSACIISNLPAIIGLDVDAQKIY